MMSFSGLIVNLSRVTRKPTSSICENKGADRQLISALILATYVAQSLYFLNPKFQASSHFLWHIAWFVSDLVANLEDRFSRDAARLLLHIMSIKCRPHYIPILYSKIGVHRGIHYFLICALKHINGPRSDKRDLMPMRFEHDVTNVVNDVLTSTSFC